MSSVTVAPFSGGLVPYAASNLAGGVSNLANNAAAIANNASVIANTTSNLAQQVAPAVRQAAAAIPAEVSQLAQQGQTITQNALQHGQEFAQSAGVAVRGFFDRTEAVLESDFQRLADKVTQGISQRVQTLALDAAGAVIKRYQWILWVFAAIALLSLVFSLLAFINTHRIVQALGLNDSYKATATSGNVTLIPAPRFVPAPAAPLPPPLPPTLASSNPCIPPVAVVPQSPLASSGLYACAPSPNRYKPAFPVSDF